MNLASEPDCFRLNCTKATKSDVVQLKLVAFFNDESVTPLEIATETVNMAWLKSVTGTSVHVRLQSGHSQYDPRYVCISLKLKVSFIKKRQFPPKQLYILNTNDSAPGIEEFESDGDKDFIVKWNPEADRSEMRTTADSGSP